MIRLAITVTLLSLMTIGCAKPSHTKGNGNQAYASKAAADAASPVGYSCEKVVQEPISRGRGTGLDGKYNTVTYYYPGYLRGDVNSDGLVNRDDAMIAVKQLFDPNKFTCPRTADIGGYPQTYVPDGFFTSQDTVLWNQFKQTGVATWQNEVICGYDCAIPNHMAP